MNVRMQLLLLAAVCMALHLVYAEASEAPSCNNYCKGVKPDEGPNAKLYVCGDKRLGPVQLPTQLPLGTFVTNYDRFAGLTPREFLDRWITKEGKYIGKYNHPDDRGFQLDIDGRAISGSVTLPPGTLVDRFGDENGSFISAADTPYSQRGLPPESLDNNPQFPQYPYGYHIYEVRKNLTVAGGPISPWFGQPGLGTQFDTKGVGKIVDLIKNGYLKEVDTTALTPKSPLPCSSGPESHPLPDISDSLGDDSGRRYFRG